MYGPYDPLTPLQMPQFSALSPLHQPGIFSDPSSKQQGGLLSSAGSLANSPLGVMALSKMAGGKPGGLPAPAGNMLNGIASAPGGDFTALALRNGLPGLPY